MGEQAQEIERSIEKSIEAESGAAQSVMNRIIGHNIRVARKARGWTLMQLADAADTAYPVINRWELGYQIPSYKKVAQLARILERPETWFYVDHEAVEMVPQDNLVSASQRHGAGNAKSRP